MRECPHHKRTLQKMIIGKTEIDYCPVCLGVFLDEEELYDIFVAKHPSLRFEDLSLWQEKEEVRIKYSLLCPQCSLPMKKVFFPKTGFSVEVCEGCKGIWLDRGELRHILEFLEKEGIYKLEKDTLKTVIEELQEVFVGPKTFQEELEDFIIVLRFAFHKLLRDPGLWALIRSL